MPFFTRGEIFQEKVNFFLPGGFPASEGHEVSLTTARCGFTRGAPRAQVPVLQADHKAVSTRPWEYGRTLPMPPPLDHLCAAAGRIERGRKCWERIHSHLEEADLCFCLPHGVIGSDWANCKGLREEALPQAILVSCQILNLLGQMANIQSLIYGDFHIPPFDIWSLPDRAMLLTHMKFPSAASQL